jgi:hypothetical protein
LGLRRTLRVFLGREVCLCVVEKLKSISMARKGVSEMLSSSIKATLLSWEAGVSGMRLGEVADHPWSNWDFEKVFGKACGKEAAGKAIQIRF